MGEYTSIYRRFRPKTFDEVIGQNHIVQTLTNQIKNDEINHAYLFTGTRGTGKTSCAKIFAKAINCLNPVNGSPCLKCENCIAFSKQDNLDIIEMDAASNNSVDDIRDMTDNAIYRPTVGRYKVYIIDEVHMLSTTAFNALLKTLEEPPSHVVFILATTEIQKIPQTIQSRCMRFDFRLLNLKDLTELVRGIYDKLNIQYEEEAITRIAMAGEGSVRDTLSVADMCKSYCNGVVKYKDVADILCTTDFGTIDTLACAILDGNVEVALSTISSLLANGRNTIIKDLGQYLSDLIMVQNTKDYKLLNRTYDELDTLRERRGVYSNYRLFRTLKIIAEIENQLKNTTQSSIIIQANIVKACELTLDNDNDSLILRINELEKELKELKKKGIKVEQSFVGPKTSIKTTTPNNNSNNETLAELKKVDEEEFENPIDAKDEAEDVLNGSAISIFTKFKDILINSKYFSLTQAILNNKITVTMDGDTFVIKTNDNFTYSLIAEEKNKEIASKIIDSISPNTKYRVDKYTRKQNYSEETINNLKELVDGKLVIVD